MRFSKVIVPAMFGLVRAEHGAEHEHRDEAPDNSEGEYSYPAKGTDAAGEELDPWQPEPHVHPHGTIYDENHDHHDMVTHYLHGVAHGESPEEAGAKDPREQVPLHRCKYYNFIVNHPLPRCWKKENRYGQEITRCACRQRKKFPISNKAERAKWSYDWKTKCCVYDDTDNTEIYREGNAGGDYYGKGTYHVDTMGSSIFTDPRTAEGRQLQKSIDKYVKQYGKKAEDWNRELRAGEAMYIDGYTQRVTNSHRHDWQDVKRWNPPFTREDESSA